MSIMPSAQQRQHSDLGDCPSLPVADWHAHRGRDAAHQPPRRPRARVHRATRIRNVREQHGKIDSEPELDREPVRASQTSERLTYTSFPEPSFSTDVPCCSPMSAIRAFLGNIRTRLFDSAFGTPAPEPAELGLNEDEAEPRTTGHEPDSERHAVELSLPGLTPAISQGQTPFWPVTWRDSTGDFVWDTEFTMFVRDCRLV